VLESDIDAVGKQLSILIQTEANLDTQEKQIKSELEGLCLEESEILTQLGGLDSDIAQIQASSQTLKSDLTRAELDDPQATLQAVKQELK
jgi:chromosome segregation ATPase